MKDLLEAIKIFLEYGNSEWPFQCVDELLRVYGYDAREMSCEHIERLDELGFWWNNDEGCFMSVRYGSC